MRKLTLLILLLISFNSFSQLIEYAEDEYVNCDSASTNLELAMCSLYKLEQITKKLDSTYSVVLKKMNDFAIGNDSLKSQLIKDGETQQIDKLTDYRKLQQKIIESQKIFLKYVELEMQIIGESYGSARERPIHENMKGIELIEQRIKNLELLID